MTREEAKQQHSKWDFTDPLSAYCYFEENGDTYRVTVKKALLMLCSTKEETLHYLSEAVDNAEKL